MISPNFYKVLEKSKITKLYEGTIFDLILEMTHVDPKYRPSFEEIIHNHGLAAELKLFKARFPGVYENAMKTETKKLKPLVSLDLPPDKLNQELAQVYGQNLTPREPKKVAAPTPVPKRGS